MYFDVMPKTSRKDLFGFDAFCNEVEAALKINRMVVIRGLRRTGKTSLMNVAFNEIKHEKMFVDARGMEKGRKETYAYFGNAFYEYIIKRSTIEKAKSYLEGLEIYIKLNFKEKKALSELAKRVNSMMKDQDKYFILFIDEAQLLKQYGFDNFLAFAPASQAKT